MLKSVKDLWFGAILLLEKHVATDDAKVRSLLRFDAVMMMVKSDYVNSSDVDDLDDACPSNVNIGYGVVLCEKCLRLQASFRKVFGRKT